MSGDCQHSCRICDAWTRPESIRARFNRYVAVTKGCWEWTGHRVPAGYGRINIGGIPDYAHRVSVRLDGRSIPEGMQIDHLCRNTSCVNPSHLEVVSQQENMARRDTARGVNK